MLLVQYWHVTRLFLSILHFSMLLQVITVRIEFPEAGSELSQRRTCNMQVALVLFYSKWGWQLVNRLGGEGENSGRFPASNVLVPGT